MTIGTVLPAEQRRITDPETGRTLWQLTDSRSNNYPLYYFTPSVTPDGRFLVFHSERTGAVQLHRLDLQSGEIGQLTDGHTADAGWAVWCEWHLSGIYNHLSAIHPTRGQVYYFQDDEIRCSEVATFGDWQIARLPAGRMPIGQSAFSPDGRHFAYIHADAKRYRALLEWRQTQTAMGQFNWERDHHDRFRNAVGATLAVVDTSSGAERTVIAADYHFHHVLFVDNETLLINHPRGCAGMWTIGIDGTGIRHLRPGEAAGAHGAMVNHQVITDRGIVYEAVAYGNGNKTYFGRYDPRTDTFTEALLPIEGYAHAGFDPAGRFDFVEVAGARHELLAVRPQAAPEAPLDIERLRTLRSPDHNDQRHHAHPFLARDRRRLYFTDWSEQGFAQVFALDVADLVAETDRRS
jgi:hypothetical protein